MMKKMHFILLLFATLFFTISASEAGSLSYSFDSNTLGKTYVVEGYTSNKQCRLQAYRVGLDGRVSVDLKDAMDLRNTACQIDMGVVHVLCELNVELTGALYYVDAGVIKFEPDSKEISSEIEHRNTLDSIKEILEKGTFDKTDCLNTTSRLLRPP
jgi:hypothetical protein